MTDKSNDGQHLGAGQGAQQKNPDTRQTGKENAPGQTNPRKGQDESAPTDPAQPAPPASDVDVNVTTNGGSTPSDGTV